MVTKNQGHRVTRLQRGAALVEFAITFMVFLIVVLGIIEFALVIYDASRLADATREATRYAIVNNPSCNIYGRLNGYNNTQCSSSDGDIRLTCPNDSGTELVIQDCDDPAAPECMMVALMDRMMLRTEYSILADDQGQIRISYTCANTGDPQLPNSVPVVTVAAENIQHPMLFTSIFGFYSDDGNSIGPSITLPSFQTSRTGEDMFNR